LPFTYKLRIRTKSDNGHFLASMLWDWRASMHLMALLLGFLSDVTITVCLIGLMTVLGSEGIIRQPELKENE